jgi:hypothetical protein
MELEAKIEAKYDPSLALEFTEPQASRVALSFFAMLLA